MEPLGPGDRARQNAEGDLKLTQAIDEHVKRWVGPIEGVFHEEISREVRVDVHWVAPQEGRPFHTLVTSGASQKPMRPPPGAENFSHMELVMFLPPEWNLAEPSQEETWPILALRAMAHYPHRHRTWLWGGHTVPLGYEQATPFMAAVLTRPYLLSPKSGRLEVGRRRIEFFSLVCLYASELDFVRKKGDKALIERAEETDQFDELFVVTKGRNAFV